MTLGPLLLGVSLTPDVVRDLGLARAWSARCRAAVGLLFDAASSSSLLAAGMAGAVPLRAEHARALAPRAGRRRLRRDRLRDREAAAGLVPGRCRPTRWSTARSRPLPIFLIWIYVGWVIVLLGAVIAAYAPSLQMRVVRWPGGPGSRFQLALARAARARPRARPRRARASALPRSGGRAAHRPAADRADARVAGRARLGRPARRGRRRRATCCCAIRRDARRAADLAAADAADADAARVLAAAASATDSPT